MLREAKQESYLRCLATIPQLGANMSPSQLPLCLEGCVASELKLGWRGELVGSKFACVLCQRVIAVARIL